jgi:hypothetical protein
MAILAENLYKKLTKQEKRLYDGVLGMGGFKQKYEQNPDSPSVTQDPNYEKFKAVADAQAAVPEKGFIGDVIDALNPFSSAEASDRSVIDEGLRKFYESQISDIQTDPTDLFPQRQIQDLVDPSVNIDEFGVGSLDAKDLIGPSIEKTGMTVDEYFADQAPGVMRPEDPLRSLIPQVTGFVGPQFRGVGSLGRDDEDVEQVSSLTEPTGLAKLAQFLPFGDRSLIGAGLNIVRDLIPKSDPRTIAMQNFYGRRFGLTDTGQVASGLMRGYNPVSGGLLNTITGGRFGKAPSRGLARAMQKRIERIEETLKNKKSDQLKDRLKQLRDLQRDEIKDRFDRGESLGSIGRSTFSGPGMAFERRNTGTGKGPR